MKTRRVLRWLGLLVLLLALGTVVGGGIVLATTSTSRDESAASVSADDSEAGIVIASVASDGPAATAGLVRGDILLKIDDQSVNTPLQLQRHLSELEVGDPVQLTVLHGDDERTLTATLGERDGRPYLGLTPCAGFHVSGQVTVVPTTPGTVIVRVLPDSPAEQAGVQAGDTVIRVAGEELDLENDLADLITAHQPGETVTIEIERPGEGSLEMTVELGEHPEKEGVAYLGVEFLPFPHLERFESDLLPFDWLPFELPPFDDEPFFAPLEGELEQGVIIRRVVDDSPADEAGLRGGVVITMIDGEPLESPQDLVDAVAEREPGEKIALTIYDPGAEEEREIEVTLAENPDKEGQAYLGVFVGGFFRAYRSEDRKELPWMQPFGDFLRQFDDLLPFHRGDGPRFKFEWPSHGHLEGLPFDLDFDLDFDLPPELFEKVPCCSGDSTL